MSCSLRFSWKAISLNFRLALGGRYSIERAAELATVLRAGALGARGGTGVSLKTGSGGAAGASSAFSSTTFEVAGAFVRASSAAFRLLMTDLGVVSKPLAAPRPQLVNFFGGLAVRL